MNSRSIGLRRRTTILPARWREDASAATQLSELEQDLDPRMFCRIHRSTIVNLDQVRGLKLSEDGEYEVLVENGAQLRLSRRYRKELQARMGVRGHAGHAEI